MFKGYLILCSNHELKGLEALRFRRKMGLKEMTEVKVHADNHSNIMRMLEFDVPVGVAETMPEYETVTRLGLHGCIVAFEKGDLADGQEEGYVIFNPEMGYARRMEIFTVFGKKAKEAKERRSIAIKEDARRMLASLFGMDKAIDLVSEFEKEIGKLA